MTAGDATCCFAEWTQPSDFSAGFCAAACAVCTGEMGAVTGVIRAKYGHSETRNAGPEAKS